MTISPYEGLDPFAAEAFLEPESSWKPIDLTNHLNGTHKALEPSIMAREDGAFLLYPGKVHTFQGESESGKSMVAQAETARQLVMGEKCLYIDFESDASTVVDRMLKIGATTKQISENLHYINPEVTPEAIDDLRAWGEILNSKYTLVVIDGVTEAFAVWGVKSIDNDEVTKWGRSVPRKIADSTGAAVLLIDHVTKSTEGRGRFALGAQAKMSYLTGASYTVEVISPLGVGMAGKLSLRIGKDRPGRVRPHSGDYRQSDRSQEAAVVSIDSTDPQWILYRLHKPLPKLQGADKQQELMDRVLDYISECAAAGKKDLSFNNINKTVRGNEDSIRKAIGELVSAGRITVTQRGQSNLHNLAPTVSDQALPSIDSVA